MSRFLLLCSVHPFHSARYGKPHLPSCGDARRPLRPERSGEKTGYRLVFSRCYSCTLNHNLKEYYHGYEEESEEEGCQEEEVTLAASVRVVARQHHGDHRYHRYTRPVALRSLPKPATQEGNNSVAGFFIACVPASTTRPDQIVPSQTPRESLRSSTARRSVVPMSIQPPE